ncbi:MAG: hypothetical protein HZA18_01845 [Nitrospirae bacterium]|nr:hypothetical protein [Nitrospirota bacterium]
MATPESISDAIIDLMEKQGQLTLTEVETHLGVSYNLVILDIDRMVERHLLTLERQGTDYVLSRAA